MVETNPVDPKFRRSVTDAMCDEADVKVLPCETTGRPGVVKLFEGILHTHRMHGFDVVGTGVTDGTTLIHFTEV